MASEKIAVASGADFENARRRNVPSAPTNSLPVDRVEVDDKKIQVKKVGISLTNPPSASPLVAASLEFDGSVLTYPLSDRTDIPRIPRRVGVYHRTTHLHNTSLLHEVIQDRSIANRNMG